MFALNDLVLDQTVLRFPSFFLAQLQFDDLIAIFFDPHFISVGGRGPGAPPPSAVGRVPTRKEDWFILVSAATVIFLILISILLLLFLFFSCQSYSCC